MATTSGISVQHLLRYPFIADRISRLGATGHAISDFYGFGIKVGNAARGALISGSKKSPKRDIVYDIFSNTRLTMRARAPGTGPSTIKPKPIGTVTTRGVRFYESRVFTYEELRDFRVLGSNRLDLVDHYGAEYVTNQLDDMLRRCMNTREFTFVNMLKGGFRIRHINDEQWLPDVLGSGGLGFDVRSQIPNSHKNQIDLGDLGSANGDIITGTWANPSNNIIDMLHALRHVSYRRSGFPLKEIWCNSNVWREVITNEASQAIGGSVFRVFENGRREVVEPGSPDFGPSPRSEVYHYELRGLPEMTWHIYDGGLSVGASVDYAPNLVEAADAASSADEDDAAWTPYLSDTEVIITPPATTARQWFDIYAILEHVQENYESTVREVYGAHAWRRRQIDPIPAVDLRVLDNFAPALKVPNAIFNPTVIF